MKVLACALVAVGLVAGVGGIAYANIDYSNPVVTPAGADFTWSYTISIDNAEFINTAANNAAFTTLYDINGLVPGSATYTANPGTPTGAVTQQLVGITPSKQNPTDNPAIPNLTVTYTGTAAASTTLGTLSFTDTISGNNQAFGNFTSQATLLSDQQVSQNTSSVPVPAPEPGSLVLLASGVLGMVGVARRRIGAWKA
jgi:hypothetical protein